MPLAPMPQQTPAMTSKGTFLTDLKIVLAVEFSTWSSAVKVPGKMMKPARRIHL
jgi:hypothetical protein